MKGKGDSSYLLHPCAKIKDMDAYRYYRADSSINKKTKLAKLKPWREVVDLFWKKTAEALVDTENGVYITGLGYLGIWMSPNKKKEYTMDSTNSKVAIFNDHTDHHTFHVSLFTELGKGGSMNYFTMDRAFAQPLTRKLSKNLKKGNRYFLRYSNIQTIFKNREK